MKRIGFFLSLMFSAWLGAEIKVSQLAAGESHTCAVASDGALFCWGGNNVGQLGLGDTAVRYSPVSVPLWDGQKIVVVGSRGYFSCALFDDGALRCWGNNSFGQLGIGVNIASVGAGFNQTVGSLPKLKLGLGRKVKRLAVGYTHACAILDNDGLKCWGQNANGSLGQGNPRTNIGIYAGDMGDYLRYVDLGKDQVPVDVCAGAVHSCALLKDQSVKCWGYYAATGNGKPVDLGAEPGEMGDKLLPVRLGAEAKVDKLACGGYYTCALLKGGKVKCWGNDNSGSLGLGRSANEILGDHPSEMGDSLPVLNISEDMLTTDLSCGSAHCCAVLENKTVKCWGLNSAGQLGLGDNRSRGSSVDDMGKNLLALDLGKLVDVVLPKMGAGHSCAVIGGGKVKCWGNNYSGQLGNGSSGTNVGVVANQMGDNLLPISFDLEEDFDLWN